MRIFLIIFLFLAIPASKAKAVDRINGPISAEVLRVVDGDTIAVRALIWPGQRVEVKVRLAGVNAPEMFRPSCEKEREQALLATEFVTLNIGDQVQLLDIHLGKYAGRVIAHIQIDNEQDLGKLLLSAGLAYKNKERKSWCEG